MFEKFYCSQLSIVKKSLKKALTGGLHFKQFNYQKEFSRKIKTKKYTTMLVFFYYDC